MKTNTRFSIISATALLACMGLSSASQGKRPNVILIMTDDMGYECVGANGSAVYATPNLDMLTEQGVRFTNCYSQPLCTPSRVQIMTGLYNNRNYIDWGTLNRGEKTFAHLMRNAGYATGIAGKWQLSGDHKRHGQMYHEAGFDESCMWAYDFDMGPENAARYRAASGQQHSRYWHPSILKNGEYLEGLTIDDYGPDVYSNFLLDFIEKHRDSTFFFYYPMTLPHGPFVPTPHLKGVESMNQREKHAGNDKYYKDMVEYMDFLIGKILTKLRDLGLEENTLLLFTSDNGTPIGISSRMKDGSVVEGGKGLTNNSGTHVPLIAYWKGTALSGLVVDDLVDFTDFLPAILEAGNVRLPDHIVFDGISFLPLIMGKERIRQREWVFCHYDTHRPYPSKWPRARYARDERYKLYDFGLFDTLEDAIETTIIPVEAMGNEVIEAKNNLQQVLDMMHKKPDFYTQEEGFWAGGMKDKNENRGKGSNR